MNFFTPEFPYSRNVILVGHLRRTGLKGGRFSDSQQRVFPTVEKQHICGIPETDGTQGGGCLEFPTAGFPHSGNIIGHLRRTGLTVGKRLEFLAAGVPYRNVFQVLYHFILKPPFCENGECVLHRRCGNIPQMKGSCSTLFCFFCFVERDFCSNTAAIGCGRDWIQSGRHDPRGGEGGRLVEGNPRGQDRPVSIDKSSSSSSSGPSHERVW